MSAVGAEATQLQQGGGLGVRARINTQSMCRVINMQSHGSVAGSGCHQFVEILGMKPIYVCR